MSHSCQHDQRRSALRAARDWNGLDYVEVDDSQRTLSAYFLGKLPAEFAKSATDVARHLRISGGHRIRDIRILSVTPQVNDDPEKDDVLIIQLDKWGDFSTYTLHLVDIKNIDPRYSSADFSFKVACPSDMDCAACPPPDAKPENQPLLNYMAKDYASFRQLLLDRMALLVPNWQERHVPDLGITLVEILAYCADQLSYYQDAVATEAYLDTARQRISVRRHARLVDYRMHEGCNARAWLCFSTDTDLALDLRGASFITGMNQALAAKANVLQWTDLRDVPASSYDVFEPLWPNNTKIKLRQAHNAIQIYTWGGEFCCLAAGSTSATMLDSWASAEGSERALQLAVGDILIFEQVASAETGLAADAERSLRHAVRITEIQAALDPILLQADGRATPLQEIRWAVSDALPFDLPLSSLAADCQAYAPLALVRGNVILVDAGQTQAPQDLGQVPIAASAYDCQCAGRPGEQILQAGKFQPRLPHSGLVWAEPLPTQLDNMSASDFLQRSVRQALPQLQVESDDGQVWQARYDLIDSAAHETHFAVETDNQGLAQLRFGDGELGAQVAAGSSFQAQYRIFRNSGNLGNVGADAIKHIVLPELLSGVNLEVRNPLPASGGESAEPMAQVKLHAPHAFKQQIERAIIAQDYQQLAERHPALQKAAAQLVWTGSWNEAEVALDPLAQHGASQELQQELDQFLQRYRRMGHDLHIQTARYVPLDLQLKVCAQAGYQRAQVLACLRNVFSNRRLADGKLGFFHPDNLSFGEGIYLSRIIALAQAQAGVECVTVTRLQRLFEAPNQEIEQGYLPLQAWEIAQLEHEPNFPERGKLEIIVHGGQA